MGGFYSPTNKTIIQVAPKCGEESVRYLILKTENNTNPENIWINFGKLYIANIPRQIPKNINNIIIVRNPYNRIVSGYIDKFLTGNYIHLPFCKDVKKYYRRENDNIRISFEELVDYIITQPKEKVDSHFKPQCIQYIITNNTRILKLENIDEINKYIHNIGFKNKFENYRNNCLYTHEKINIENAYKLVYNEFDIAENRENKEYLYPKGCDGVGYQGAKIPNYENFYNESIKGKIYNYYKEDFIRFNYNM